MIYLKILPILLLKFLKNSLVTMNMLFLVISFGNGDILMIYLTTPMEQMMMPQSFLYLPKEITVNSIKMI